MAEIGIKNCQNCKKDFTIEPASLGFYEKMQVPVPTFCPMCRLQRRLTWRNERTLYKRTCALCNKNLIAVFHSSRPFPVYCSTCYHGDSWDPLSYGKDVDFSRPLFTQFKELQNKVPRQYALVLNNTNCEYANGVFFSKNCYLAFVSDRNEDCSYIYNSFFCKNSYDLYSCSECQNSAHLLNSTKCATSFFSMNCRDCFNIFASRDCAGSHDLIGCVNLRDKQYCIFNEQYTKEEYQKKVIELNLNSYGAVLRVLERANKLAAKHPVKYMRGAFNVNSTGDELYRSKNTRQSFASADLEDCAYIIVGQRAKDCEDCYVAVEKAERAYDCIGAAGCQNIIANHLGWFNFDSTYTDCCEHSHNLFMCVGLRKKQYCILNKQYSKEEYEKLRLKIIEEMNKHPYADAKGRVYKYGEFFPAELSPYAYNETVAIEYFPMTKEEATKNHYDWAEEVERAYTVTMPADSIPDDIRTANDELKVAVIGCEHEGKCTEKCTKAFKLTPQEFQFYKQYNLPLPRFCPNCRHYQRLKNRNPITLSHRACQCAGPSSQNGAYKNQQAHYHGDAVCANEFETPYSSERSEIVYCEQCYQQEAV